MIEPIVRPLGDEDAEERHHSLLGEIRGVLGQVPNVLRTVAHSPAALESLWGQIEASTRMALPPRTRRAVALRVAELNGCRYCLAAHTAAAVDDGMAAEAVRAYRLGRSDDPKEQVVLALVTKVVKDRGQHTGFVVQAGRRAGLSDAELIEAIALVAMHTFANYVNALAKTPLDFPPAESLATSAASL